MLVAPRYSVPFNRLAMIYTYPGFMMLPKNN